MDWNRPKLRLHNELWEMSDGQVFEVKVWEDQMTEVFIPNRPSAFVNERDALDWLFFHLGLRLNYRVSE